jgi:hypothetical protein
MGAARSSSAEAWSRQRSRSLHGVLEASAMSEAASATQSLTAISSVLLSTSFGGVLFAQALALLAANLASRVHPSARRRLATVGLARLATALQAGHSHDFAMEDGLSLLLFSQGLHLLATGAWLGGLVPLLIVVREAAPKAATEALALFRSRCSLRCRDYGNRMVAGLASRRWRERPDRNSLWLGAPAEDCAIRRSVRPRGSQSLSPYPRTAAPTHTACKEDVDLYHRTWPIGCGCCRSAEQPRAGHAR